MAPRTPSEEPFHTDIVAELALQYNVLPPAVARDDVCSQVAASERASKTECAHVLHTGMRDVPCSKEPRLSRWCVSVSTPISQAMLASHEGKR